MCEETANLPVLGYLETNLVDHCNLNCKSCGHFSNIADKSFYDVSAFEKDMQRLAELFSDIKKIRLMGGEPLLHPELVKLMGISRKCFPNSWIVIVTNGILLAEKDDLFWKSCLENNIAIEMTTYPIKLKLETIKRRAEKHSVVFSQDRSVEKFVAFMNIVGDSPIAQAIENCGGRRGCTNLYNGFIYRCPRTAYVSLYNKKFGTSIPSSGYDTHAKDASGPKIVDFIKQPVETCRFCSLVHKEIKWGPGKGKKEEWLA